MTFVGFCLIIYIKERVKMLIYFQIVKLDGSRETPGVALDASVTQKRMQRKKEWMLKLLPIFLYRLNNSLVGDFIKENNRV